MQTTEDSSVHFFYFSTMLFEIICTRSRDVGSNESGGNDKSVQNKGFCDAESGFVYRNN